MEHYECKNQNKHHIFTGNSVEELLQAIAEWWSTVPFETSKMLNAITFFEAPENETGTIIANVFWSHLEPDQEREVVEALTTPQELNAKPSFTNN